MTQKNLGIYIHIPFCKSKCPYCDFCSFPHKDTPTISAYALELCRRIKTQAPLYQDRTVDTIYFGGGTPTLLPLQSAEQIMTTLRACFHIIDNAEITLECNPGTVTGDTLTTWHTLGVNRLSMGAQSANPAELKALGRLHTWEDVCTAVEMARNVGIDNINLDFMMGIPHQTKDSLADTLNKAISLAPQHLSSYCLSLEEGTPYHKKGAEKLGLPDDDTVTDMYLLASSIIREAGYNHYEISNFCLPGHPSQHNLSTWRAGEYVGFGVAAHSHVGLSRFGNSRDMNAFLRGEDIINEAYTMTSAEAAAEALMLGLRLSEGVHLDQLSRRFGVTPPQHLQGKLTPYQTAGYLQMSGDHIQLTETGWLVSNQILSEIWGILDDSWS